MEYWIYLAIMAVSTYLIRSVPFALVRKRITSPFIRSFLYYIPYAVLTAMTFPAVLYAVDNMAAAAVGFLAAIAVALMGKGLTTVAAVACAGVFITDWLLRMI